MALFFRVATPCDVPALVALEQHCFTTDRLSPRSFQWMISRAHGQLLVAEQDGQLLGYALVLFHRGTSLARLYSIAIAEHARGLGLGKQLLARIETIAVEQHQPIAEQLPVIVRHQQLAMGAADHPLETAL